MREAPSAAASSPSQPGTPLSTVGGVTGVQQKKQRNLQLQGENAKQEDLLAKQRIVAEERRRREEAQIRMMIHDEVDKQVLLQKQFTTNEATITDLTKRLQEVITRQESEVKQFAAEVRKWEKKLKAKQDAVVHKEQQTRELDSFADSMLAMQAQQKITLGSNFLRNDMKPNFKLQPSEIFHPLFLHQIQEQKQSLFDGPIPTTTTTTKHITGDSILFSPLTVSPTGTTPNRNSQQQQQQAEADRHLSSGGDDQSYPREGGGTEGGDGLIQPVGNPEIVLDDVTEEAVHPDSPSSSGPVSSSPQKVSPLAFVRSVGATRSSPASSAKARTAYGRSGAEGSNNKPSIPSRKVIEASPLYLHPTTSHYLESVLTDEIVSSGRLASIPEQIMKEREIHSRSAREALLEAQRELSAAMMTSSLGAQTPRASNSNTTPLHNPAKIFAVPNSSLAASATRHPGTSKRV